MELSRRGAKPSLAIDVDDELSSEVSSTVVSILACVVSAVQVGTRCASRLPSVCLLIYAA